MTLFASKTTSPSSSESLPSGSFSSSSSHLLASLVDLPANDRRLAAAAFTSMAVPRRVGGGWVWNAVVPTSIAGSSSAGSRRRGCLRAGWGGAFAAAICDRTRGRWRATQTTSPDVHRLPLKKVETELCTTVPVPVNVVYQEPPGIVLRLSSCSISIFTRTGGGHFPAMSSRL